MLTRARKTLKSKGAKIFKESAHKLHFDDDFFDLSFEVTVLQHIIDENMFKQTLKELKRVTSSSGLIFLCGEMARKDKVVSPYTALRSIDSYSREMKPWKLKKTKNHKCITDNYKLTLWSL
jgi:ubiquinone/menaquinone biosynthesis C-methylase UbiE